MLQLHMFAGLARMLSALTALLICAASVHAEFTIENNTNETVHVALAYSAVTIDPVFGSGSGSSWTEGWYDVEPGQSRTFNKIPDSYYASSNSHKWVGAGNTTHYVLPRKPFNRINQNINDQQAQNMGYERRSFEKVAPGTQTLSLSFGGTVIHVRNGTNNTMNFKAFYVRPSDEQVHFNDWQTIKPNETKNWVCPTDGAQPDLRQVINGPKRIMIGVKGTDPFGGNGVTSWGFDDSGNQVIGLESFKANPSSEGGRAFMHVHIGLR